MTLGSMRIEYWITKAKENKSKLVGIEDVSNRILYEYKGPNKCNFSLYVMKERFSCQKAVSNRHQDGGKLHMKKRLPRNSLLHIYSSEVRSINLKFVVPCIFNHSNKTPN